jgi:hypothetical protein
VALAKCFAVLVREGDVSLKVKFELELEFEFELTFEFEI